ncbi:TonB-dependent receptor plug domain-containing protein [Flavobacterium sp. RHBU_24]|uniref:TonB-dependent receptor plug domain-containing protein n=1 Tax=Flavobacterium sp. RHBU_24 TaxID=3391185 RepID=UPI003984BA6B
MLLNKFLAIGIPLLCFGAFAQEQKQDSIKPEALHEVFITATRTNRNLQSLPLPGAVIDSATIMRAGVNRLSELLAEQTGLVTVPDFGGGEGLQMQGLDSAYTLILIDGVPLVGRSAGTFDLSRITVGNIERIEIVKGASSSLYGSEALAGVINIITKKPEKEGVNGAVSYRYGAFETHDGNATLNFKRKKLYGTVFANHFATNGYDLVNTDDTKTVEAYNNTTLQPKVFYDFSGNVKLTTSVRLFNQKQDYNQTVEGIYYTGDAEIDEVNAQLRLDQKWSSGFRTEYELYTTNYQTHQYLENYNGQPYDEGNTFYNQWLLRPEFRGMLNLGRGLLTTGVGMNYETLNRSYFANRAIFNSQYVYTQYDYSPTDKLNVLAGARFDNHNRYSSQLSPKLAVRYDVSGNFSLKTSMGYGYKAPDFRQLYFDFNNAAVGYTVLGYNVAEENLDKLEAQGLLSSRLPLDFSTPLKAESSVNYNFGGSYKKGSFSAEGNLFYNTISNLIDTRIVADKTNGQNVFSYYNVNKVNTYGLEANATYKLAGDFRVTAGYQYLIAKDPGVIDRIKAGEEYAVNGSSGSVLLKTSDYFGLPNRSRHSANLKLYYTLQPWKTDFSLRVVYRSKYGLASTNGNDYIDKYDNFVAGYFIVNLSAIQHIGKNFLVQAGANNLLDFTNEAQISNISGRQWYAKVQYNF